MYHELRKRGTSPDFSQSRRAWLDLWPAIVARSGKKPGLAPGNGRRRSILRRRIVIDWRLRKPCSLSDTGGKEASVLPARREGGKNLLKGRTRDARNFHDSSSAARRNHRRMFRIARCGPAAAGGTAGKSTARRRTRAAAGRRSCRTAAVGAGPAGEHDGKYRQTCSGRTAA